MLLPAGGDYHVGLARNQAAVAPLEWPHCELTDWGENEDKPGSFGRKFQGTNLQGPIGICLDKQGRVWVSTAGGRVQQFSESGQFLRGIGEQPGSKPGEFLAPHGIAINSRSHLFVVDAYNHRIQKDRKSTRLNSSHRL